MSQEGSAFGVGVLAGIAAACIVMVIGGPPKHQKLQKEAVERGYAEWRLTHAHNGTTEFRWLDSPKNIPSDKP